MQSEFDTFWQTAPRTGIIANDETSVFAVNAPRIAQAEWVVRMARAGEPSQAPCPPSNPGYVVLPLTTTTTTTTTTNAAPSATTTMDVKFSAEDVPPNMLPADQQGYLAGIQLAYDIALKLIPATNMKVWGLRVPDGIHDTVNIVTQQLLTLLYETQGAQNPLVGPMVTQYALHEKYMTNLALRTAIYGDLDLTSGSTLRLSPFTWRHAVTYSKNQSVDGVTPHELKLRDEYKMFTRRLFNAAFTQLKQTEGVSSSLVSDELAMWNSEPMSVAVCEARTLALIAQLKLVYNQPFVASTFRAAAIHLRRLLHPMLGAIIGTDLYIART